MFHPLPYQYRVFDEPPDAQGGEGGVLHSTSMTASTEDRIFKKAQQRY